VFVDTRQGLLAAIAKLPRNHWDVRLERTKVTIDPNRRATVWGQVRVFLER